MGRCAKQPSPEVCSMSKGTLYQTIEEWSVVGDLEDMVDGSKAISSWP